jgi:hypothetical protein
MARAECKFNKAGQGLFFTTILYGNKGEQFNFVYDCGTSKFSSQKVKDNLSRIVEGFKSITKEKSNPDGKLDLLAISHFHEDHISHIPKLIENMDIGVVMIPFVTKEIRLLLASQYFFKNQDTPDDNNEILSLYQNPINFFHEKGAKSVIVCYGEGQEDYKFIEGSPENIIIELGEEGYKYNYPKEIHWKNGNNSIEVQIKGEDNRWIFKPYNLPIEYYKVNTSDYKTMVDKLNKILEGNGDDWRNILSCETKLKKLKEIYKEYFKKDLNDTSLFVRSYPEEGKFISNYYRCCSKYYRCCCQREYYHRGRGATLLTGDGYLKGANGKEKHTIEYLQQAGMLQKQEPIILQLPHHGSKHNIDQDALDTVYPGSMLVASYGLTNWYKHPSISLISDILDYGCFRYVDVNEDRDFAYTVHWGY